MYLPRKVFGLPKASKDGHKTSARPKYHMYRVKISGYVYYKVHLKRQEQSKIKYFKTKLQAQLFIDSLHLQPYM